MAHRIITQMAFTGARVLGRAFTEAYKQASASQVHSFALYALEKTIPLTLNTRNTHKQARPAQTPYHQQA